MAKALSTSAAAVVVVVVVVLTYTTCQNSLVTAQMFTNCYLDSDDPDVTVCSWSDSPIIFSDGTSLDDSTLVTSCDAGESFTSYNCNCFIYIEDATGVYDSNNYCNSCTLLSLSATSFSINWDCSNRLVGRCTIMDYNGCQTGDDQTPFPAASPINFPTDPPVDDQTSFPVASHINFPTDPPEDDPTPFPVVSPIINFPTYPPVDDPTPFPVGTHQEVAVVGVVVVGVDDQEKKEANEANKASEANVPVKSRNCNRRARGKAISSGIAKIIPIGKTPETKKNGDTDSETKQRCTTSDGDINRYYYAVGMSSFVMTIISMVFLV